MIKHIVLLFLFLSVPMTAHGGWDFSRHSIPPRRKQQGLPHGRTESAGNDPRQPWRN